MRRASPFIGILVFLLFLLFLCLNRISIYPYLSFSDSAKFADIARNLVNGNGYNSNFSNFASEGLGLAQPVTVSRWVPPAMPLAIAGIFKLFRTSDLSVIATSSSFYLLLILTTYLLGKRLFGNLVGLLAAIAVAFNPNFLDYAVSGASETLFAFEIVLAAYLFILGKKRANVFGFLVLILMYFTRAQAIIYIFGFLLLFFLLNFPIKKALSYFSVAFVLGSAIYLLFSKQGLFAVTQHLPGVASSDALRGGTLEAGILPISKKIFYNLYNFYRLLPQIMSPYLWALFIIGLFKWGKDRVENSFKIATIFMVAVTFLAAALTIPFFRYLHPVVPLVYIFATTTLLWILGQIVRKEKKLVIISSFLIFIFVVGQTLGIIFLDSRFITKTVNKRKPPVYVVLSRVLRENTTPDSVVVTNLDTWGSWYGERKTIWFPLEPKQLIGPKTGKIPFDAIYLTSYLIDDENYYMGPEWRQIFENPKDPMKWVCNGCDEIAKEFTLKDVYKVAASDDYEKQGASAILLIKKHGE